jgi:hypothetical protein
MSQTVLLFSVATLMAAITLHEVSTSSPICYEAGKQVTIDHINNKKLVHDKQSRYCNRSRILREDALLNT